jgi:hypothetical protein
LGIASIAFAQGGSPAYAGSGSPPKVKHAKAHERITVGIGGAEDKRSAEMLTSALNANGLKGTVREAKGKPAEVMTSVEPTSDLSAFAKAVAAVDTPDRATAPPTLSLVLFAPLTTDSAKLAMDKLAAVAGVDAKNSKADLEKGEIWVRISGEAKVTPADISAAIQSAGVTMEFTKGGKGKQS